MRFILILIMLATISPPVRADGKGGDPQHPAKKMSMNMRWRREGFGTILMATALAVRNNNSFAVKDFVIHCEGRAPSGTTLQSIHYTLYEKLKPGQTRQWNDVNMGFLAQQVSLLACEVEDAIPLN